MRKYLVKLFSQDDDLLCQYVITEDMLVPLTSELMSKGKVKSYILEDVDNVSI